mgnify:CR=1 FL=1|jgi:iron-only hydrogenase maturation rSAM protein HydE
MNEENILVELTEKLKSTQHLDKDEWISLFDGRKKDQGNRDIDDYIGMTAREISVEHFGHDVYTRGLIEFTSFCRNDCYYCGLRSSNKNAERYRLTKDQILECCRQGYDLGFRTFVLQGGEDPGPFGNMTGDEWITDTVRSIRSGWPDCAVTLSVGERSRDIYQKFFDAGAERFLLRHETADPAHYRSLHPASLSLENRLRCLRDLKDIGYQTGTGFMVGSPGQNSECLAEDMLFIEELQPEMIGIGPFVPHHDTPFARESAGTAEDTLFCLSALRLMMPDALIPATTALGTILPDGRERGILAGANVIMPNLSPVSVRKKYELYDNKICTGEEAAECRGCLERRMMSIGYSIVVSRGDHPRAGRRY